MSLAKTSSLQAYNMLLFRNALHPEFFGIQGRKRVEYSGYEFEGWIFRGGHMLRFQYDGLCVSELVTEHSEGLPDRGLISILPCAGEKDHEAELNEKVSYLTTMQTETLSDHLYLATYHEMMDHGRECDGLMSVWTDGAGKPNLSLLDTQRYNDEIHIQSYHLRSDCGLVLRTQTIFQVTDEM